MHSPGHFPPRLPSFTEVLTAGLDIQQNPQPGPRRIDDQAVGGHQIHGHDLAMEELPFEIYRRKRIIPWSAFMRAKGLFLFWTCNQWAKDPPI